MPRPSQSGSVRLPDSLAEDAAAAAEAVDAAEAVQPPVPVAAARASLAAAALDGRPPGASAVAASRGSIAPPRASRASRVSISSAAEEASPVTRESSGSSASSSAVPFSEAAALRSSLHSASSGSSALKSNLKSRRSVAREGMRVKFGRKSSVHKDGHSAAPSRRRQTNFGPASAGSETSSSYDDDDENEGPEEPEVEEVEYIEDERDVDFVAAPIVDVTCKRSETAHNVLEHKEATYIDLMLNVYASQSAPAQRPEDTLGKRGIRAYCYWVANHVIFRIVFTALLLANILLLAVEADANVHLAEFKQDVTDTSGLTNFLFVSEHVFTALFTLEIVIRLIGSPVWPWKDGWLMSDTIIVGLSIVDIWILGILQSTTTVFASFGSFRAIRIFRAFRAFRVIRILRYIRPLRLVAEALSEAFKSIMCTITLTFVVTWSASVVITSSIGTVFSGSDLEYDSFTFCILMLHLILLQGVPWGPYVVEPMVYSDVTRAIGAGVVMILAILAIVLGFLNIIRGVFTTTLLEAATKDTVFMNYKSLTRGEFSVDEMKRVYRKLDKYQSDSVPFAQFSSGIKGEHKAPCEKIGLLASKAPAIFRVMDINRSGAVSLEEFLLGCIKVRWTSKSVDTLCMDQTQNKIVLETYKLGMCVDHDFNVTKNCLAEVERNLDHVKVSLKHLLDELNYRGKRDFADSVAVGGLDTGPKNECDRVVDDLESRFSFMTRLVELKETTRRKAREQEDQRDEELVAGAGRASVLRRESRVDDADRVSDSEGAGVGAADLGAAPSQIEDMWSEIVFQEALPWIRSRLTSEKLPLTSLTRRGSSFSQSAKTWVDFLVAGAAKAPAPAGAAATAKVAPQPPLLPRPPPSLAASEQRPPGAPRDAREGSGLRPSLLTPVDAGSVWYDDNAKSVKRADI